MGDVSRHGRTVLFVSHNMQAIRTLCKRAIWLRDGELHKMGDSESVVESYLKATVRGVDVNDVEEVVSKLPPDSTFRLQHVALLQDGITPSSFMSGKAVDVVIHFSVLKRTPGLHVYIDLLDAEETILLQSINNGDADEPPVAEAGDYVCRVTFPAEFLAPRQYEVSINAGIANVRSCLPEQVRLRFEVQASGKFNRAYPDYVTPGKLAPLLEWKTEFSPRTVTSTTT